MITYITLIIGLIGFIASLFPIPRREVVQVVTSLTLLFSAYSFGERQERLQWELKVAQLNEEIATLEAKSQNVTTQVVTKYVDRVKIVKEKGDEIITQVPVYVGKPADDHCIVNVGFVLLHDAAAKNEVPRAAGDLNAEAPGIKLSTVASTVAGNYNTCHQTMTQLESLQEWIREQETVFNKGQ